MSVESSRHTRPAIGAGLKLRALVLAAGAAMLPAAWPSIAVAQDTTARLQACRAIADISARAACYDRVVDGLPGAAAPSAPPAAPRAATAPAAAPSPQAAAPPTPLDRFGEKDLSIRQRVPENELPPDEIIARVSSLRTDQSGYATVTLENGQVWRQIEASSLRLSNNARVKIRSGVMGVFYLSLETGNKSFRVRRVK